MGIRDMFSRFERGHRHVVPDAVRLSSDITDALEGAAAPSAANVFATMADAGGGSAPGALVDKRVLFIETAGAGTYTATFPVAAGTLVLDVQVINIAAWDADTMAYTVQDGSHLYFSGRSLAAAYDPLAPNNGTNYATLQSSEGEDYALAGYGSAGPGDLGAGNTGPGVYYATDDTITCTLETTGAGGTTGRTLVSVRTVLPAASATVVKS